MPQPGRHMLLQGRKSKPSLPHTQGTRGSGRQKFYLSIFYGRYYRLQTKIKSNYFFVHKTKICKITSDENNLNKPNIEDKNNKMNLYFFIIRPIVGKITADENNCNKPNIDY